ncbi:uncharacterized protein LACBIDRAFT_329322 [Laccaria bicolor S238N-H82]|uniref:Predicted protein n=1 Tax=Laccaria bicolor (strain S238N-H82 / ATCC MYA-4686) TaxID=486041 RepID=B0DHN9_LACBS|nr:uncharacterized protein LACBIDRAFT_329322 [Laccaria bicolor S238N-H82]EDR05868.1 predicted protein [Laccaria bicolor S238N-H82]|eukprot:XP_001883544.1 predicted protein [Laccaria bicolor S238N-H82]
MVLSVFLVPRSPFSEEPTELVTSGWRRRRHRVMGGALQLDSALSRTDATNPLEMKPWRCFAMAQHVVFECRYIRPSMKTIPPPQYLCAPTSGKEGVEVTRTMLHPLPLLSSQRRRPTSSTHTFGIAHALIFLRSGDASELKKGSFWIEGTRVLVMHTQRRSLLRVPTTIPPLTSSVDSPYRCTIVEFRRLTQVWHEPHTSPLPPLQPTQRHAETLPQRSRTRHSLRSGTALFTLPRISIPFLLVFRLVPWVEKPDFMTPWCRSLGSFGAVMNEEGGH